MIGLANGEVVRTMYMRPKSLEDGRKNEEVDKIKGQPWDPSVTLTFQRFAQAPKDRRSDARRRGVSIHAQVAHDQESRIDQGR